ncbi:DUF4123 domain-containing protein [Stenotrophomonas sp. MH1]|uniref:DUF4123 domain-containing protein n=1 Tax=Stenotrophomonas capsici TaxID=3110230 RepID=A0ABU5V7S1_9GAMM|nr:DUF4123 domain-containing protein [Stenotrophomonas sp. MH1]MEA5669408.1 DUF4123 domain-containing protein [Stenotrophomonas sp. MH1]
MDTSQKKQSIQRFLAERAAGSEHGLVVMLDRFLDRGAGFQEFVGRDCHSVDVCLKHPAFTDVCRTPRLVHIRPEDSDLIARVLDLALREQAFPLQEAAAGLSVAGWMETDAPLEVLARHFAVTMEQRLGTTGQLRVLRISDRRVLEFVWALLDIPQRRSLLGPITHWHFIDRRDEIQSLALKDGDQRHEVSGQRLRLDHAQWLELEQCQQVQEMARGWKGMVDVLPKDYLRQLRAALASAKRLGLSVNHDIQLLAAYILQIHPLLASHPTVVALVERSVAERSPLMDALAEIPDPEGWDQIKSELGPVRFPYFAFDTAQT